VVLEMSVPLLVDTYKWDHGLSGRAIAVYRWLAWRENAMTGQCDPSHQDIARGTGFGVTTVRKALDELHDAGWVAWRGQTRTRGRGRTSNAYELTPPVAVSSEQTPQVGDRSRDLSPTNGDGITNIRVPPRRSPTEPSPTVGEQELEVEREVESKEEEHPPLPKFNYSNKERKAADDREELRQRIAYLRGRAITADTPAARERARCAVEEDLASIDDPGAIGLEQLDRPAVAA
jgi:hypothetical protein